MSPEANSAKTMCQSLVFILTAGADGWKEIQPQCPHRAGSLRGAPHNEVGGQGVTLGVKMNRKQSCAESAWFAPNHSGNLQPRMCFQEPQGPEVRNRTKWKSSRERSLPYTANYFYKSFSPCDDHNTETTRSTRSQEGHRTGCDMSSVLRE